MADDVKTCIFGMSFQFVPTKIEPQAMVDMSDWPLVDRARFLLAVEDAIVALLAEDPECGESHIEEHDLQWARDVLADKETK